MEAGAVGDSPDAAAFEATAEDVWAQERARAQIEAEAREQALEQARARAKEIIAEAEADARAKSDRIIEDAREEVAVMLLSSREQAEEVKQQAWQEGYAGGAQEGKRSYDEQLKTKLCENEERLNMMLREDDEKLKRVIEELYDERTRTFDGLEDEILELALDIVRKVINPAEDEYGKFFELLIRNALRQMNPDGRIIIRVGPGEYDRFFAAGGALFELDRGVTVTASVVRDPTLGNGDCIIDAGEETVDAGLESQLKYIQLAFDKVDAV